MVAVADKTDDGYLPFGFRQSAVVELVPCSSDWRFAAMAAQGLDCETMIRGDVSQYFFEAPDQPASLRLSEQVAV